MKNNDDYSTYNKVGESVKKIKDFYNHLQIFAIMILVLVFFSDAIISFFEGRINSVGT